MNIADNPKQPTKIPQGPPDQGAGFTRLLWFVILAAVLYSLFGVWQGSGNSKIAYSQFKKEVGEGKVAEVTMHGQEVTGQYKQAKQAKNKAGAPHAKEFETDLPPMDDPALLPLLQTQNVTIRVKPQNNSLWTTFLIFVLPFLLLIGFFVYAGHRVKEQMAGGGLGGMFKFAKSTAKRYHKSSSDVTFDDVAGLQNAKLDLMEIVGYLKDPERYRKMGAKLPRGILLMGPPGTGKTLITKAVAGEADVPFFSISGSEFVEMLVGVGAARVRDMFENAKKEAPAVIFIDEIDSVGRSRGTGLGGGNDEREQTLNQILSEMDGFAPGQAVIVLAATNRPDVLDPALMRPGRFDRKITMELPRKDARRKILDVHSRHIPLADDVDLDLVAKRTVGFSGADLENLINEAALLAVRDGKDHVEMATLQTARDKIILGAERETILDEGEKRRVAYHESGHTLLACLLPNTDPVDVVTIIPRGQALGVTEQLPEEDRYSLPESYLKDRIAVMLGGRVAEKLVFGETSSGAENDLQNATGLARRMIGQWGMSEKIGPAAFRRPEEHPFLGREMAQPRTFSEQTAWLIDEEIRMMLRDLDDKAQSILAHHRHQLDAMAEALLEKEILSRHEILELVAEPAKRYQPDNQGREDS